MKKDRKKEIYEGRRRVKREKEVRFIGKNDRWKVERKQDMEVGRQKKSQEGSKGCRLKD